MTAPKVNLLDLPKVDEKKNVQGSQSTQESRAVAEQKKLKGTDIYSYAQGGYGNYDGNFQNFDGFCKMSDEQQEEQNAQSLLKTVKSGIADAKSNKSNCNDYSEQATNDVNNISKNVKKTQQLQKKTQNTVTKAVTERDKVDSETTSLRDKADDLNAEIADLMAEDGEDYTPDTVPEAVQAAPQATDNAGQANEAQSQDGQNADASSGTVEASGASGNAFAFAAGNSNPFMMNSAPADANSFAPTSITGMSAQNSQQAKEQGISNGQNANNKQSQQTQQQGANKAGNAAATGGNPLSGFASNLAKSKGKNADKIAALQAELGATNSQIVSNQSKSASLTNTATKATSSFKQQLNKVMSQTVNIKTKSKDNHKAAQAANLVGQTTSTAGGAASAVGASMLAWSWGTAPIAHGLIGYGAAGTVAGSTTSSVAQGTMGDTAGAFQAANSGISAVGQAATMNKQLEQQTKK